MIEAVDALLANPPRMIRVTERMDALQLHLPSRLQSSSSSRNKLLIALLAAYLLLVRHVSLPRVLGLSMLCGLLAAAF